MYVCLGETSYIFLSMISLLMGSSLDIYRVIRCDLGMYTKGVFFYVGYLDTLIG